MGRTPCCEEIGSVKKGPWTPEEDHKLMAYITKHGSGSWRTLPKLAGLNRCGKSCRLRWTNYLRPDIRRGKFTEEEDKLIINLHSVLGNKWSKIATHLPGRTDNEIKNYWNTNLRKKLLQVGIDPETHKPRTDSNQLLNLSQMLGLASSNNNLMGLVGLQQPAEMTQQLVQIQLLQNLLQLMSSNSLLSSNMQSSIVPFLGNHTNLMNNPIIMEENLNGTKRGLINNLKKKKKRELQGSLDISESSSDHHDEQQVVLGINKISSSREIIMNNENYPFGATNSSGYFNQMDGTSNLQDEWEKLLQDDEDASDSYWKQLLDLTSASTSPISW